jgi:hypothetical protein
MLWDETRESWDEIRETVPTRTTDNSAFENVQGHSEIFERLKPLHLEQDSSDDEEQERRYRQKKKRWSAGVFKRSHSQSVEGNSSDNDSDLNPSARRLRRRVRRPIDRRVSLIFQDPGYVNTDNILKVDEPIVSSPSRSSSLYDGRGPGDNATEKNVEKTPSESDSSNLEDLLPIDLTGNGKEEYSNDGGGDYLKSREDSDDLDFDCGKTEEPCKHETQFGGLCVDCGKDINEVDYFAKEHNVTDATVKLVHDNTALVVCQNDEFDDDEEGLIGLFEGEAEEIKEAEENLSQSGQPRQEREDVTCGASYDHGNYGYDQAAPGAPDSPGYGTSSLGALFQNYGAAGSPPPSLTSPMEPAPAPVMIREREWPPYTPILVRDRSHQSLNQMPPRGQGLMSTRLALSHSQHKQQDALPYNNVPQPVPPPPPAKSNDPRKTAVYIPYNSLGASGLTIPPPPPPRTGSKDALTSATYIPYGDSFGPGVGIPPLVTTVENSTAPPKAAPLEMDEVDALLKEWTTVF